MLTKNVCPRLCPTSIKGNKIECEFYAQALNLQCSFFFLFAHTYIFSSNKNSDRWFRIQSTKFKFLHFVHFIHIKQDFFIETCIKIVKAHAKKSQKVNIYTANIYGGNWDTLKKVYKLQVFVLHIIM